MNRAVSRSRTEQSKSGGRRSQQGRRGAERAPQNQRESRLQVGRRLPVLAPLVVLPLLLLAWGAYAGPSPATAKAHGKAAAPPAVPTFRPGQRVAPDAFIKDAKPVGTQVCEGCHASAAKDFQHALHALRGVGCEDCHGGGSVHVQRPGKQTIVVFASLPAASANAICLGCHGLRKPAENWTSSAHARNEVRCTECHTVHVARPKLPSREDANALCTRCHAKQKAEGTLPYHHPVLENKMTCTDCHDPHGGRAGNSLVADSVNELCSQCHAQYEGPFAYQHPPVTESCLKCHAPHGSVNRPMLTVSQPILCLQCHPGHHNGSGLPLLNTCTSCHNSIHGSDVPSATGGSVFIDKP